jgi:hypothetical protein
MELPPRQISETYLIDANCINARQADPQMNQIEHWREAGVINVEMAQVAYDEALSGGGRNRGAKTRGYVYSITLAHTQQERDTLRQIAAILFPPGCKNANERNDVELVFNAIKYHAILVTRDGASKRQPGGILGNCDRLLKDFRLRVMTPENAVTRIRAQITRRDELVRRIASKTGELTPEWVGTD